MFKVGDIIEYGFYSNVEIVDIGNRYYLLKDSNGTTKKVLKSLVNRHGKLKDKLK